VVLGLGQPILSCRLKAPSGYAVRESAWAGQETNSGPPCSTLDLQVTPCTFGRFQLQTFALETRGVPGRSSQTLSHVEKTDPNGWSPAQTTASTQKLGSWPCCSAKARGRCGQSKSVSRRGHCSAKDCCPASNAYERGHGDVRHQGKKSKGNTHGRVRVLL
jgi:hypothetical protein